MRSLSCTFIWQPNVSTKKRPAGGRTGGEAATATACSTPIELRWRRPRGLLRLLFRWRKPQSWGGRRGVGLDWSEDHARDALTYAPRFLVERFEEAQA